MLGQRFFEAAYGKGGFQTRPYDTAALPIFMVVTMALSGHIGEMKMAEPSPRPSRVYPRLADLRDTYNIQMTVWCACLLFL